MILGFRKIKHSLQNRAQLCRVLYIFLFQVIWRLPVFEVLLFKCVNKQYFNLNREMSTHNIRNVLFFFYKYELLNILRENSYFIKHVYWTWNFLLVRTHTRKKSRCWKWLLNTSNSKKYSMKIFRKFCESRWQQR